MRKRLKKAKACESLKAKDIPGIPDNDLLLAVMRWMRDKAGGGCEFDVIASLPLPCQYVYACDAAVVEVCNGGLDQYYFNTGGVFAALAEEGFRAIGSPPLAAVMRQADQVAEKSKVIHEEHGDGLFDELDCAFYNAMEAEGYDALCVAYIRGNAASFGD